MYVMGNIGRIWFFKIEEKHCNMCDCNKNFINE